MCSLVYQWFVEWPLVSRTPVVIVLETAWTAVQPLKDFVLSPANGVLGQPKAGWKSPAALKTPERRARKTG